VDDSTDYVISVGLFGMNHFKNYWKVLKDILLLDAGRNVEIKFNDFYFHLFLLYLLTMKNSKYSIGKI